MLNREDYELEDFLMDESFSNYHFHLNAADELSWKIWLKHHPEKIKIISKARDQLQTLSLSIGDNEYLKEFEKLQSAILSAEQKTNLSLLNWNKSGFAAKSFRKKLIYAAPVFLIFVFVSYLYINKEDPIKEVANNTTSSLLVILSDSTQVTLKPHALISYPAKFNSTQRNVHLEGEAEFNVRHDDHAPFRVYYKNLVATVLGTIFKIRRPFDSSIVIELIKGKLKVDLKENLSAGREVILNPNEKLIYNERRHLFYVDVIVSPNNLSFHQNTFEEIAVQIKHVFGITVVNESKYKNWRFTGSFKNTSAKEVVENICLVKNLSMEIRGNSIYIR